VQLVDRVSSGVIAYGLELKQKYLQLQNIELLEAPARASARLRPGFVCIESSNVVILCDMSATNGTWISVAPGNPQAVISAVTIENYLASPLGHAENDAQADSGRVLEMSPMHRSLQDKAREEMSDFEREYPW
jgi:hypothetical protein